MLDAAVEKSFQERFNAIRTLKTGDLVPKPQQSSLTVKDVRPGGFFTYLDRTYYVKEMAEYEECSDDFSKRKGFTVTELTCLCLESGDTVGFEWEHDDELEVTQTLERFRFRDLTDDAGEAIDEDDLDQIADDSDVIVLKGEKYWYEDDWASIYQKGSKEEKVYMYEFENDSHTRFLTIEEWDSGSGKESYQIYTSHPVEPMSITLISKGGS
ncbi:MAG: DUF4178 domain-containing protein [Desulfobacteraceae bacterium]|nr:MAG: DUF4178 domain-containing protein [Desulfobacteraceae bacterium]